MEKDSSKLPVEFRLGATGAGLFAGCGAGVGLLTPVSLHAIPFIGQAVGGVASSFWQIDAALGGWMRRIGSMSNAGASRVGMRAGVGCGVAVGYGWGAGLMLKPAALTSLSEAIKSKVPLLDSLHGLGGSSTVHTRTNESLSQVLPSGTILPPPPQALPTQSQVSIDKLEKEVGDLTKLVVRQQVLVEELQNQLVELREQRGGGVGGRKR